MYKIIMLGRENKIINQFTRQKKTMLRNSQTKT